MNEKEATASRPKSIVECFESIRDPRVNRTRRHKLVEILVIGLCSMLTGGEGFSDMQIFGKAKLDWLKTFLELPHAIPSHDTFNRVFSAIDPNCFLECFVQWVQGICPALGLDIIAIDGKALRRALNEGDSIPYIVSAWASENGIVLGQVKVDDKSNEITAIPQLLRVLMIKGCIVTIDAMGCQKEIAAKIIDKDADYVLALKGNHATAHEEIKEFFSDAVHPCDTQAANSVLPNTMDFYQTIEKNHGRIEIRRYWQSIDIDWFQDKGLWKNLTSIGMVESIRRIKGKNSIERRYFLNSLPLNAQRFAKAVRGHWGVENPLHWTLDVTFAEDQSRARTKYAAQNLATLRRIALNLVKNNLREKTSQRQKRLIAALDTKYLEELLGF
ncbi:MAG: ISAs1 family transposase [Candidatus Uhrbacteria bacterium]